MTARADRIFKILFSYSVIFIPIFYVVIFSQIDFSQVVLNDDYTDHSLGHALNLELWFRGIIRERNNYFQYFHPGIWFQLFSWVSLKFAVLFNSELRTDSQAFFKLLIDSRSFFFFSGILSASIIVFFLLWFKKILKEKKMFPETVFILALFFVNHSYISYSFLKFSNEFFIIPIIFFAFYLLSDLKRLEKEFMRQLALGVFFAFCYLNKLPYIVLFISFIAVYTGISFFSYTSSSVYFRVVFVSSFFFVLTSGVFLVLFFSKGIAMEVVNAHFGVFLSSGHYGNGEKNIVSADSVLSSFNYIQLNYNPAVLLSISASVLLLLIFLIRNVQIQRPRKRISRNSVFLVVWSLISFFLGFAAVLKHFNDHYLIMPISCLIPGVIVAFQNLEYKKRVIFLSILFLGLAFSLYKNINDIRNSRKYHNRLSAVLADQIGKEKDLVLIYDYRFPIKEYISYFTLYVSGIPEYKKHYPYYLNKIYVTSPGFLTGASSDTDSDVNRIEWDYWLIMDRKNDDTDSVKKILLKSDVEKKEIMPGVILAKNLRRKKKNVH